MAIRDHDRAIDRIDDEIEELRADIEDLDRYVQSNIEETDKIPVINRRIKSIESRIESLDSRLELFEDTIAGLEEVS